MGRHGRGRPGEETWELVAPEIAFEPGAPFEAEDDAWPPEQRGQRTRGRAWGFRALVVVFVVAAAFIGYKVATAVMPSAGGEVIAKTPASSLATTFSADRPRTSEPSEAAAGSAPTSGVSDQVQVHVVGAVKNPGLYVLEAGVRVNAAVKAAGGATAAADLAGLNLAAPAADGAQIRVPTRGEATPAETAQGAAPASAPAAAGSQPAEAGGTINLNTADATTLQTLPGIGPALSERLIEWREAHGRFRSDADLDAVPGIGPAMLEKLKTKVSYG